MEKYYGNYLGIVVNTNDPESRNRIQVWVPNLTNTLYNNWNTDFNNKIIDYNGYKVQNNDYKRLINALPWAECASPLIGGGTAMNLNPYSRGVDTTVSPSVDSSPDVTGDGTNPDNSFVGNEDSGFTTDVDGNSIVRLFDGTYVYPDRVDSNRVPITVPRDKIPAVEPDLPVEGNNNRFSDGNSLIDDASVVTQVPTGHKENGDNVAKEEINATISSNEGTKKIKLVAPVSGTVQPKAGSAYGAIRPSIDPNIRIRTHIGGDVGALDGSPVNPVTDGVVLNRGTYQKYDATMDIWHPSIKKVVRYAMHGSHTNLAVGSQVTKDTLIGTIGKGHLHIESIPEYDKKGVPNELYNKFLNNRGTFVSTSNNVNGTEDPFPSLGMVPKTFVNAKSEIGQEISVSVAAQDTQTPIGESNIAPITNSLDHAIAAQGNPSPAGAAKGVISCPSEGARVWVFFYGGDIQKPVYFAMSITGPEYQTV